MTEVTLREIHEDIESLKQDVADLKEALLGDDGELSEWAKQRIEEVRKTPRSKFISQEKIEKEFL